MDNQTFISILKNTEKLKELDLTELQQVVKDYPFFNAAQLLLAKKYHLKNNPEFEKQLKIAAVYAADRKILNNLIHGKEKAEIAEENKIEQPTPKLETIEIIAEQKIAKVSIEEVVVVETIPKKEKTEQPKNTEINPNEKHSFAEWLLMLEGKTNTPQSTKPNAVVPPIPVEEKKEIQSTTDNEQPAVINVEEMALQSLREDENLISATLADIYANQGKFEKAIKLFEKLIVQFPEKKDKFAEKIKNLKSKI